MEYVNGICLSFGILILYSSIKVNKDNHKKNLILMRIERSKQVFLFLQRMYNEFPYAIDIMPEYDDVLNSDKPLEAKYWIDVDKLVNLN